MPEQLIISQLAMIWLCLTIAYIIFGISGFGSALVASPILALFLPVDKIVPLLALLDCTAAVSNILRDKQQVVTSELKRLIPLMIIGSLIGATILLYSRPDILLLALGLFVIGYSLYSLSGYQPVRQFTAKAAIPFGFIGGIFSALFGSGGFIYIIYLSGRIADKNAMRMTQTTLIGFSTFTRVIIFLCAGIYSDWEFIKLALLLLPAILLGTFIGRRITLRLSRQTFLKVINITVLCSGIMLVTRYLSLH